MEKNTKLCKYCKKEFETHSKGRIVLEFWKDPKHLSRFYFCTKNCFVSFLKENKII